MGCKEMLRRSCKGCITPCQVLAASILRFTINGMVTADTITKSSATINSLAGFRNSQTLFHHVRLLAVLKQASLCEGTQSQSLPEMIICIHVMMGACRLKMSFCHWSGYEALFRAWLTSGAAQYLMSFVLACRACSHFCSSTFIMFSSQPCFSSLLRPLWMMSCLAWSLLMGRYVCSMRLHPFPFQQSRRVHCCSAHAFEHAAARATLSQSLLNLDEQSMTFM
jgi:hypothetical protein